MQVAAAPIVLILQAPQQASSGNSVDRGPKITEK